MEQITNREKKEMVKTLSREEIDRLKKVREFESVKPGSWAYKIALECDQLRQQKNKWEVEIQKLILTLKSTINELSRLEEQLASGKITEELKPGIPMNEHELAAHMENKKWTASFVAKDLAVMLGNLRGIVEHKDYALRVIITDDEFEKFAERTITEVESLGFKVLS